MRKDDGLNKFERFFMWSAESKMMMGLYFAYYVIVYLFFGLFTGKPHREMNFAIAFEMMCAAFILGVLQKAVVLGRANRITWMGSILWVTISTGITFVFCTVFGWFNSFPTWCYALFIICVAVGVSTMIYFYHLQLKRETRQLNKMLEAFQSKAK